MMRDFDTIISGGYVVDRTRGADIYTESGIGGDDITEIGTLRGCKASVEIDTTGKIVAQGAYTQHRHYNEKSRQLYSCGGVILSPMS